jgi:geranylgeranyl diphosphate synthase type I
VTGFQSVEQPLDLVALRARIDAVLRGFLSGKAAEAAAQGLIHVGDAAGVLGDFLAAGGKRLRPLLCVIGSSAVRGHGDIGPVVQAGAALEMFHAFALIHDDIMDGALTRRGQPTVHRVLAARHQDGRTQAAAERLGIGAAILIGDLAMSWSDELLHTAGLTSAQLGAVLPVIDTMRTELMYGQYLDLITTGHPTTDLATALKTVSYKTARYTYERPLHIGAALAGAPAEVFTALTTYALPLGEAFQLRDDLLGVYGDPARTGKSVLDDLREGKHTVLVAIALQRATAPQRITLRALVGKATLTGEEAARIRLILQSTGACVAVENMIDARYRSALRALELAPFPSAMAAALRQLAWTATARTS